MYLLVDTTNSQAIAVHVKYRALAALAYIQFANVDCTIVPINENKGFSQFDDAQLQAIAINLGGKLTKGSYSDTIKQLRYMVNEVTWLRLPITEHDLLRQAHSVSPQDDEPRLVNNAGVTTRTAKLWTHLPQRNRKRCDSSYGTMFRGKLDEREVFDNSGVPEPVAPPKTLKAPPAPVKVKTHHSAPPAPIKKETSTMATTEKAAAKKAATKKTAATKTPAKKPSPAKPTAPKGKAKPAAPKKAPVKKTAAKKGAADVQAPREGSITETIFKAADAITAKKGGKGNWATHAEVYNKLQGKVADASIRSGYQKWRQYNGIVGRIVE